MLEKFQAILFDLFEIPNIELYLGITLVVLVALFFLVFFVGKKDKKEFDKTQELKLQQEKEMTEFPVGMAPATQIVPEVKSVDTIAPVMPEIVAPVVETPVEALPPKAPIVEPVAPVMPVAPVVPVVEILPQTPVTPVVEPLPVVDAPVAPVIEQTVPEVPVAPVAPVLPVENEMAPINLNEIDSFKEVSKPQEVDVPISYDELMLHVDKKLDDLEKRKELISNEIDNLTVASPTKPVVEPVKTEPVKESRVMSNVFSSVYVPVKNDEVKQEEVKMEEPVIPEIPEPVLPVEEKKEEVKLPSFDDEEEIELPKLKTVQPVLKDDQQDTFNV